MPAFEYQAIDSKEGDGEGGTDSTSKKCTNLLCTRNVAVGVISACVLLWLFATKAATNAHLIQTAHKDKVEDFRPIMHISDTHVDPFFDPTVSMVKYKPFYFVLISCPLYLCVTTDERCVSSL